MALSQEHDIPMDHLSSQMLQHVLNDLNISDISELAGKSVRDIDQQVFNRLAKKYTAQMASRFKKKHFAPLLERYKNHVPLKTTSPAEEQEAITKMEQIQEQLSALRARHTTALNAVQAASESYSSDLHKNCQRLDDVIADWRSELEMVLSEEFTNKQDAIEKALQEESDALDMLDSDLKSARAKKKGVDTLIDVEKYALKEVYEKNMNLFNPENTAPRIVFDHALFEKELHRFLRVEVDGKISSLMPEIEVPDEDVVPATIPQTQPMVHEEKETVLSEDALPPIPIDDNNLMATEPPHVNPPPPAAAAPAKVSATVSQTIPPENVSAPETPPPPVITDSVSSSHPVQSVSSGLPPGWNASKPPKEKAPKPKKKQVKPKKPLRLGTINKMRNSCPFIIHENPKPKVDPPMTYPPSMPNRFGDGCMVSVEQGHRIWQYVMEAVSSRFEDLKFDLMFDSQNDGDEFWKGDQKIRILNKGASITIIRDEYGNVFGGFNPRPWRRAFRSGTWQYSRIAFLFLLHSEQDKPCPRKFSIVNDRKYQFACANCGQFGPVFGDGHDLCVASGFLTKNSSYSVTGSTYETGGDDCILSSTKNFRIVRLQMFTVRIVK